MEKPNEMRGGDTENSSTELSHSVAFLFYIPLHLINALHTKSIETCTETRTSSVSIEKKTKTPDEKKTRKSSNLLSSAHCAAIHTYRLNSQPAFKRYSRTHTNTRALTVCTCYQILSIDTYRLNISFFSGQIPHISDAIYALCIMADVWVLHISGFSAMLFKHVIVKAKIFPFHFHFGFIDIVRLCAFHVYDQRVYFLWWFSSIFLRCRLLLLFLFFWNISISYIWL